MVMIIFLSFLLCQFSRSRRRGGRVRSISLVDVKQARVSVYLVTAERESYEHLSFNKQSDKKRRKSISNWESSD